MKRYEFCEGTEKFCTAEQVSFHMPGHKGRLAAIPSVFDTTELDGTDNLYAPASGGTLDASLTRLSALYGTESTLVLAGGATLALLSAVHAAVRRRGRKILSERKIHRSLVYAYALCGAEPLWLACNEHGELSPGTLADALRVNPDAAAVLLTSPDYYGQMHDVAPLAAQARSYGVPLIVDAAHGAHLDFLSDKAFSPVGLPGTLVAQSLHKTLPALTGAALLHANVGIPREELLSSVRLFGSSSPSYLISRSAFDSIAYMEADGAAELAALKERISAARAAFFSAGFSCPAFPHSDPFRLTVRGGAPGNADALYSFLYRRGIVCEFSDRDNLVLIPSVMNTETDFELLASALHDCDTPAASPAAPLPPVRAAEVVCPVREAVLAPCELRDLRDCAGRIAAEPVSPYPPGIALLVPGERIGADLLPVLEEYGITSVRVIK